MGHQPSPSDTVYYIFAKHAGPSLARKMFGKPSDYKGPRTVRRSKEDRDRSKRARKARRRNR